MTPRKRGESAFSRRRFLRLASGAGLAAAAFGSLGSLLLADRGRKRLLLMVRLAGGVDGLDLLAPLAQDDLRRLRPRLAADPSTLLPVTGDWGLRPDCRFFHEQFRSGALAIIHGVGSPLPVLSHERARVAWRQDLSCGLDFRGEASTDDLAASFRSLVRSSGGEFPSVAWFAYGDFDSHADQRSRSALLWSQFSRHTEDLLAAVEQEGLSERVLIVFYSEFGRSAGENAFGGTDHGNAAPVLVLGKAVRGGLYGEAPRLDRLRRSSPLAATVDRRTLLGVLSERWLERSSPSTLSFEPPGLNFI